MATPAVPKEAQEAKEKPDFKFIVRIAGTDLNGQRRVVDALMDLKGLGYRMAEIVADRMGVPRGERIGDLTDKQVEELAELLTKLREFVPAWALNRQKDFYSGESYQVIASDLDVSRRDDINRMKMIRSYKGVRHDQGQKVRGQRTRSNGRSGLTVGVVKKAAKAAAAAASAEKKEEKK